MVVEGAAVNSMECIRMSARLSFLAASLLVTAASPAFAATEKREQPPVVVIATRVPTPLNQIASSVTVVKGADIEAKQQRTLPEVLREVPGLSLIQTGTPGGVAAISIRGTNFNHTKVIIDGMEVNDPSTPNGAFDFSQLLTTDIERLEVLRGPQSGLWGSDSIGGVINIVTKKGTGPAQYTASVEGGSFHTFNQTAGVSGGTERYNYAFTAEHYRTGQQQVTPANLVPAGRARHDDEYDNKTLSTKLGANLTDNLDVGFTARYIYTDLDSTTDDFGGSPQSRQSENKNNELFTRGTIHHTSYDGKLEQILGLTYVDYRRRFADPNSTPFTVNLSNGDRIKGDWQGNLKICEGQIITLGAEHQRDTLETLDPVSASIRNSAGFTQLQSSLGERFFNTLSLRLDDNSRFGHKGTYRLAPAFMVAETGTKLKASYGTGFKAPSLTQLFQSNPGFGFSANPNLQPETSKGYDLGFEQDVLNKKIQFGSSYFHNEIKNLIDYNAGFTTLINVGKATTRGFENFIAYKPLNILTFRSDYTFTIAENDIRDQQLLRRPKHKASFSTIWQTTDKLSLTGTILYTGPQIDGNRDFSVSRMTNNSYTTVNISTNYDLNQTVTLFGRVNNLFDQRYQTPVGFEQPGLGAYAGIKTKF